MDSVDIMNKAIKCLRLELSESIIKDVEKKWCRVEFYISWLKYQINEYGSHKADCKTYLINNVCSCGYEVQESDMMAKHIKEIEMRNGIMNRQKRALGLKDKKIKRLGKEKEWLEYKVLEASQKRHSGKTYDEKIAMLEDDMQRALCEDDYHDVLVEMQQALKEQP